MSRVGLIGSNSVEFIDKLLSIWNNNDSAVLIDYDTPAKAAADMLSEVGAYFCYVEDTIKDKYGVMSSFLTLTGYSVHNKIVLFPIIALSYHYATEIMVFRVIQKLNGIDSFLTH